MRSSSQSSRQCQTAGGGQASEYLPWADDARADAKTDLLKYVRGTPNGAPFSLIVTDVFGASAVDEAGRDYQLARRFFNRRSEFRVDRRDGVLWVQPSIGAFHLSPQYANGKTSGGRRDGMSNGETAGETGDDSRADCRSGDDRADCQPVEDGDRGVWDAQYPKDRAESVLSKRLVLDGSRGGHDYRDELLAELGTERAIQSDKFKILRRVRGTGKDYLLMPYTTRFNSRQRAASIREEFQSALATAADDYRDAVVMTLTTDPSRFDSLEAAMDGLTDAKGRLMSWLATEYQLGYRPANLSVLEFSESGLPHVHIVLFGVGWAVPQSVLAAKWDDLGQGRVVDIRRTTSRSGSARWLLHNDDGGTVTLRRYLGKAIDELHELAGMDDDAVRAAAEAGEVGLWKQALYWATGRQYYSCSPSLKRSSDDGDRLPFVRRYEFVGAARYKDIPAHIKNNAVVFVDRGQPPPG